MLLLLSDTITPRLQYIAEFIFKENWGIEYVITTSIKDFKNAEGVKINYTPDEIAGEVINVQGSRLLFEKKIYPQHLEMFEINSIKAFFKNKKGTGNFHFDIFSATFYLLTRYEEYLPHSKDKYGRFDHQQSLASLHGFLKVPLINTWLQLFADYIKSKFPGFTIKQNTFTFSPTYDVDIAFDWLQKGLVRNMGKFLSLLFHQEYDKISKGFKILSGKEKDSFDIFKHLDQLHEQYNLQPHYFFLVTKNINKYDRNISPLNDEMQTLIRRYTKKSEAAIHPSFYTFQNEKLLKEEKFLLEEIAGDTICESRQHYLRFSLPETYRTLSAAGIKDEYSMGYGTINGFRASYANSFFWYDVEREEKTNLKIHPFCYMDSNVIFHEKLSPEDALAELKYFYTTCKNVGGTFISVMHNHLMAADNPDWKNVYETFLAEINGGTINV